MAVIEGTSGTLVDVGAASAKGLHVIAKPQDAGTLGHYAIAVQTGAIPQQDVAGLFKTIRLGIVSGYFTFKYTIQN